MAKRTTKKIRNKNNKKRRNTRKMKGGFPPVQEQWLSSYGLNEDQIEELNNLNIGFEAVVRIINTVSEQNPDINSDQFAQQIMIMARDLNVQNIRQGPGLHDLEWDNDEWSVNNESIDNSNGELRLSDLESRDSGYTTEEDTINENRNNQPMMGGIKKKLSKKSKKSKTHKNKSKRKNMKGGMCYGNGIGANTYDPNYSIYNTNMLNLFPYKTN